MSTSLGSEGGGGGSGGGWDDGTGLAEGQFPDDEPPLKRSRKRTKQGVYTSDITLDDLAAHFHQPASKACQELGMGLTIFKRVCRKLGLQRWPYEKPCKADGERTSGGARAGGTPRGTGSWHLPPVTQAWAGGARAGNHAAAPGGSRASSGQASGQELVAAAAQIEGALQQQDKRVRSAAIQHLAEILVKDSEAAAELLAAIGTAVQQCQPLPAPLLPLPEGQQQQQQEQPPAQQQQLLLPPPLPALLQPLARRQQAQPQRPGPQLPALQPQPQPQTVQHSQVTAQQQQGTVEQLLAALHDVQPPASQPISILPQQPTLAMNLAGQHPVLVQQPSPLPAAMLLPGPQQPAAPQQQDDLAAMLDVLRSALEMQAGTDAQLARGVSGVAAQAPTLALPPQPHSAPESAGPDRITPLLQQLLSWGQPPPSLKQEHAAVGSQSVATQALASVAALHGTQLLAKPPPPQQQQQQQQQGQHAFHPAVAEGSASPTNPQASQQVLAMELVAAAAQGQASSQAAQQPLGGPQQHNACPSTTELNLLAAIQQARAGTVAQPATALQQAQEGSASAGGASSP